MKLSTEELALLRLALLHTKHNPPEWMTEDTQKETGDLLNKLTLSMQIGE